MKRLSQHPARRVVLTGGPCAGKTTIAELLGKSFPERLVVVPESASMLIRGGFPRWKTDPCRAAFQAAVYRSQLCVESAYESHYDCDLFLFDRGTIDGAAYWPSGLDDFFGSMNTSEAAELSRYDHVIYLESAEQEDYEIHFRENPTRSEAWTEAKRLDSVTQAIWSRHSRISMVRSQSSFQQKVAAVFQIIERELEQAQLSRKN
jgi:predicted ATPase